MQSLIIEAYLVRRMYQVQESLKLIAHEYPGIDYLGTILHTRYYILHGTTTKTRAELVLYEYVLMLLVTTCVIPHT